MHDIQPDVRSRFRGLGSLVEIALNGLATVQFVWFYLIWVHSSLIPSRYEAGLEQTPYQTRVLMMFPLRWAHQSQGLNRFAEWLSTGKTAVWFDRGISAEGIVQAAIDVCSVVCIGLIARKLYDLASPRGIFRFAVYPLTLVMILATYGLSFTYHVRYFYDLPSVALFGAGLLLLYRRSNVLAFCAIFLIATVNRETSLMLLVFYALRLILDYSGRYTSKRRLLVDITTIVAMAVAWGAWHVFITRHFAHNPTASMARWKNNVFLLLSPLSWPQLASTGAFMIPVIVLYRRYLTDRLLRTWLWGLAVWFVFMMIFGVIIEIRIYGELIPYLACCTVLIAEAVVSEKLIAAIGEPNPMNELDFAPSGAAPERLKITGERSVFPR
ncbi:MAG TPA: hypothetical protein VGU25_06475 [Acidobacteriaceae bacterium]|nr:hypothetical protein [Acidobacteriaceae bacterium]